jgi:hypothetical protein
MKTETPSKNSMRSLQKRAEELLNWLIGFLPGTIPPSAEDAILDVSEDVHALFYHRSELQKILAATPQALNQLQREKLSRLDREIRAAALLLVGAGKGMLHRYREGRYDRTHWWWYLEDALIEESLMCNQPKAPVQYAMAADKRTLSKVADVRAKYETKPRGTRK